MVMKCAKILLPFVVAAHGASITPTEKVAQMLRDMLATGRKEMQREQEIMVKYNQFVHDHNRDWNLELGSLRKSIEKQSAIAAKNDADAAEYQGLIKEKQKLVEETTNALAKATKARGRAVKVYQAESTEYEESVDALERAIKVLKAKKGKQERVPQAFIQQLAVKVPQVLVALQQPQAKEYAYEFQGGKVVDMLEKLHDKFEEELNTLNTEEANARHAYNMLKQQHEDEIANLNDAVGRLQGRVAEAQAASAEAKQNVANDTQSKNETGASLKELLTTHGLKKAAYENNQKVRQEELAALSKAIEILSGHSDVRSRASFLQVGAAKKSTQRIRNAAAFLLKKSNTPIVAFQLMTAAKTGGALDKVVGMIRAMISKLEKEHAAEGKHHEWCQKNMKENKAQVAEKTAEVEGHMAAVSQMKAALAQLNADAADAEAQESELTQAMAQAQADRAEEKEKNEQTIADASAGKEAVGNALTVLREFYERSPALLQTSQVPEMDSYSGQGESSKGVVGMLEVIQADFARLETETTASENEAIKEHTDFMKRSEADKVVQHKRAHDSRMAADRKDNAIHRRTKTLKNSQAELDDGMDTKEKLHAACVPVKVSYEERVAMREQEISNLEDALKILNGQDE